MSVRKDASRRRHTQGRARVPLGSHLPPVLLYSQYHQQPPSQPASQSSSTAQPAAQGSSYIITGIQDHGPGRHKASLLTSVIMIARARGGEGKATGTVGRLARGSSGGLTV